MPRERKATDKPAQEARRPQKTALEPRVQRRILRFVNLARGPDDLVAGPRRVIRTHVEQQGLVGPDLHEPMPEHERKPVFSKEQAERIIAWRDENSPFYGFLDIRQFRELIPERLLDVLTSAFGAAAYGRWDAPIVIPTGYDRPVHAQPAVPRWAPLVTDAETVSGVLRDGAGDGPLVPPELEQVVCRHRQPPLGAAGREASS
jgi:hypothetical protein